jgi:hypothetical protein
LRNPLAAAVELIHTTSLIHDDINDRSGLRRGRPTANARWGNTAALLKEHVEALPAIPLRRRYNYLERWKLQGQADDLNLDLPAFEIPELTQRCPIVCSPNIWTMFLKVARYG